MNTFIPIDKLNNEFGTQDAGEDVGYGEMAMRFTSVNCENLDDFHKNADFGQCWTDEDGVTYYKIRNAEGDAEAFYVDKGEIVTV